MDFPEREVAEQLTRLDAVGLVWKYFKAPFCAALGLYIHTVSPSGAVCQSGALPLPGLRLVPARQEGKPKPGTHRPRHHLPVQRRHQPRHHLPPLPVRSRPCHFLARLVAQVLLNLPVPLRRPELALLRSPQPRPQSASHREVDRHRPGQRPRGDSRAHNRNKHNFWQSVTTELLRLVCVCVCAGVQTAEEFLLTEGHPVSPAVERCVSPQEDLGCSQQVCTPLRRFAHETKAVNVNGLISFQNRNRAVIHFSTLED